MIKSTLSAAAAIALLVSAVGCSNSTPTASREVVRAKEGPSRAYHMARNVPSHGVALEGYCPVAYFAVNKPVRGKPEFASDYKGITYHFVSAEARDEFDANPEKYVPAYGGWCAFGMAVEDKFPVDPTSFKIVDGRLMLFLQNDGVDALDLWNDGNETELATKADQHWKKVQG